MIFLLFSMIVFTSFWDRFREAFWLDFGSTFRAFGSQQVAEKSTIIDAKIGIEKSRFRGGTSPRKLPWLVPGGPPLNVGINLLPRTLVGLPPPGLFFSMFFSNFFPYHFWDGFWMVFWMFFGKIFVYLSCFIWMASGIFLKLAALAKSAPRPHGSMVFEVLALRFLMVFSVISCYFP